MLLPIGSARISPTKLGGATTATYAWRPRATNEVMQRAVGASFLLVPLVSCATTRISDVQGSVHISVKSVETVPSTERHHEILGVFEIENRSPRKICFNEDILVNSLSPYVNISINDNKQEIGIPHPPVTSDIANLNPGEHREIRRILDYATSSKKLERAYTISVKLWDCDTSNAFVARAKFRR